MEEGAARCGSSRRCDARTTAECRCLRTATTARRPVVEEEVACPSTAAGTDAGRGETTGRGAEAGTTTIEGIAAGASSSHRRSRRRPPAVADGATAATAAGKEAARARAAAAAAAAAAASTRCWTAPSARRVWAVAAAAAARTSRRRRSERGPPRRRRSTASPSCQRFVGDLSLGFWFLCVLLCSWQVSILRPRRTHSPPANSLEK